MDILDEIDWSDSTFLMLSLFVYASPVRQAYNIPHNKVVVTHKNSNNPDIGVAIHTAKFTALTIRIIICYFMLDCYGRKSNRVFN